MQGQGAGVGGGEEVFTQARQQGEGRQHTAEEAQQEASTATQRKGQQVGVAHCGEAALEGLLEIQQALQQRIALAAVLVAFVVIDEGIFGMVSGAAFEHMGLEQEHRQGRHQGPRQDERAGHGEDHRQGHRPEQVAGDALQHEHRYEHDADTQQRDERRADDLFGTVENRRLYGFALFQVPVDVLDGHRRIVYQDTDRQRQPAEGHDIEGLPGGGAMIRVERQLPRNSRIIALVSSAAMIPSRATLPTDSLTNTEASPSSEVFSSGGSVSLISGNMLRIPSTIDRVEILPFFIAGISTARRPSTRRS